MGRELARRLAVFPPLNLLFNANIYLVRVPSNPKLCAHFTNLCFAVICKFLGDFWEEIFFLKVLVKFGEIRNI